MPSMVRVGTEAPEKAALLVPGSFFTPATLFLAYYGPVMRLFHVSSGCKWEILSHLKRNALLSEQATNGFLGLLPGLPFLATRVARSRCDGQSEPNVSGQTNIFWVPGVL